VRRLARQLRSWYDYSYFQVSNEWPVLLSVAGVILGAWTILPSSVGIALGAVAFIVGLGAFLRDVHDFRRRWGDFEFTAIAAPFPTATIPPPSAYPAPKYLYVPNRGTALISDLIDEIVAGQPIQVQLDAEPYRLPKKLKGTAPYVLREARRGRVLFNGEIIGMHGDPIPPGPVPPPPIRIHIARFFDAQCSNEMCNLQITHRSGEQDYDPRSELLVNANGQLRTLAESTLADCIGISTIAFTADNELVLTRQTTRNIASPRLLAPSGSGSLDLRDLRPADSGAGYQPVQALQDIVRHGMERELCEETGIRPDEIVGTKVIGFARWLERGAKPEFFGVTELSVTAAALGGQRRLASDEKLFTDGTFTLKVDLTHVGRDLAAGNDLLSIASLPARIKDQGSLPLLLALRTAALRQASAVR